MKVHNRSFIQENSNQPNCWTQLELKNVQKQVKLCIICIWEKFITTYLQENLIFSKETHTCTWKNITHMLFPLLLIFAFQIFTMKCTYFYSKKRTLKTHSPHQINTALIFPPLCLSSEKIMVRQLNLKLIRFTLRNPKSERDPWEEPYNFCSNGSTHYFFSPCSENRLSTWTKLKFSLETRYVLQFSLLTCFFPLIFCGVLSLCRYFNSWGEKS